MDKHLKILLWASGFSIFASQLFGPLYAVFVEEIGGDLITAGSSYALFAIAGGVLVFIISRWEDRVKHQERLVVAGYFLGVVGYAGYMLVERPLELFIVQIIFGVAFAVGTPAYDGLYSRYLDKGRFASEWGAWESMAMIVTGVAAFTGGWVASVYGFDRLFLFMIFFSSLGLFSSIFLTRRDI